MARAQFHNLDAKEGFGGVPGVLYGAKEQEIPESSGFGSRARDRLRCPQRIRNGEEEQELRGRLSVKEKRGPVRHPNKERGEKARLRALGRKLGRAELGGKGEPGGLGGMRVCLFFYFFFSVFFFLFLLCFLKSF